MFFKKIGKHIRDYWVLHLMALPGVIALLLFSYAPKFGALVAFQKFNYKKGFFGSQFVGFKNFEFLFSTSDAWVITRNTVLYNLVFIVLGMMLLDGKSHKKIRFLYAGIISAVMLITGIGMTANLAMHSAAFAKRQILNSTIGYTVTKAGTSDTDLSFDIEKDTSATISVNVKNAEGDYKIVIDGDKGSSVINAEVPAGDPRKITYNVALQPDHYRIKVDAGENAVGEKPLFDFLVN